MITNLYIVCPILYGHHLYRASYVPFAHAGPTLWNALPLFNQLAFLFGQCGSWGRIQDMYPTVSNISRVFDWKWIGILKASLDGMT